MKLGIWDRLKTFSRSAAKTISTGSGSFRRSLLVFFILIAAPADAQRVPEHIVSMTRSLLNDVDDADFEKFGETPLKSEVMSSLRETRLKNFKGGQAKIEGGAKLAAEALGLDVSNADDRALLQEVLSARYRKDRLKAIAAVYEAKKQKISAEALRKKADAFEDAMGQAAAETPKTYEFELEDGRKIRTEWDPKSTGYTVTVDHGDDRGETVLHGSATPEVDENGDLTWADVKADDEPVTYLSDDFQKQIASMVFGIWSEGDTVWIIRPPNDDVAGKQGLPTPKAAGEVQKLKDRIKELKGRKVFVWRGPNGGRVEQDTYKDLRSAGFEFLRDESKNYFAQQIADLEAELKRVEESESRDFYNAEDPLGLAQRKAAGDPMDIGYVEGDGYRWAYDRAEFDGEKAKGFRTYKTVEELGDEIPMVIKQELIASWNPPSWVEAWAIYDVREKKVSAIADTWSMHVTYPSGIAGVGPVSSVHTPHSKRHFLTREAGGNDALNKSAVRLRVLDAEGNPVERIEHNKPVIVEAEYLMEPEVPGAVKLEVDPTREVPEEDKPEWPELFMTALKTGEDDLSPHIYRTAPFYLRSRQFAGVKFEEGLFNKRRYYEDFEIDFEKGEFERGEQEARSASTTHVKGDWFVTYKDGDEAYIGRAKISDTGDSARLALVAKKGYLRFQSYEMRTSPDGEFLEIRFERVSTFKENKSKLAGKPVLPRHRIIDIPTLSGWAVFKLNDAKAASPVKMEPAPNEIIRLLMKRRADGRYAGAFRTEFTDAKTRPGGQQTWTRNPTIEGAYAITDQFNRKSPARAFYPYKKPASKDVPKARAGENRAERKLRGALTRMSNNNLWSNRRDIFVYGKQMPVGAGDAVLVESLTPGITYEYRVPSQIEPDQKKKGFETARKVAEKQKKTFGNENAYDYMMLVAKFDDTVKPGVHMFKINGVVGQWFLTFADATAKMYFVDQPPPMGENTDVAFIGDVVRLEMILEADLPFGDELEVPVTMTGNSLSQRQDVKLKRQTNRQLGISEDDEPARIPVYRSKPIHIVSATNKTRQPAPDRNAIVFRVGAKGTVTEGTFAEPEKEGAAPKADAGGDGGKAGAAQSPSGEQSETAGSEAGVEGKVSAGGMTASDSASPDSTAPGQAAKGASGGGLALADSGGVSGPKLTRMPRSRYDEKGSSEPEATLSAIWGKPQLLRVGMGARLLVFNTPDDLKVEDEEDSTWGQAVKRAKACYKGRNLSKLGSNVTEVKKVIITELGTKSVQVTLADHAALILVKDEFLREGGQKIRLYDRIASGEDGKAIENALKYGATIDPIWSVAKFDLEGRDHTLADILQGKEHIERVYPEARKLGYEAFITKYAKLAAKNYVASVQKAMKKSIEDGYCNIEPLLVLGTRGIPSIEAAILPRLVRLHEEDGRQWWEPDMAARATVLTLPTLGAATRALESYSKLDTTVSALVVAATGLGAAGVASAAGAATAAAGLGTGASMFSTAAYATLAADVIDIAIFGALGFYEWAVADKADDFAYGAASVLGPSFYEEALSAEPSLLGAAAGVLLPGLGVWGSVGDLRHIAKVDRGREIASTMKNMSPDAVKALSEADREALVAFAKMASDVQKLHDLKGVKWVSDKLREGNMGWFRNGDAALLAKYKAYAKAQKALIDEGFDVALRLDKLQIYELGALTAKERKAFQAFVEDAATRVQTFKALENANFLKRPTLEAPMRVPSARDAAMVERFAEKFAEMEKAADAARKAENASALKDAEKLSDAADAARPDPKDASKGLDSSRGKDTETAETSNPETPKDPDGTGARDGETPKTAEKADAPAKTDDTPPAKDTPKADEPDDLPRMAENADGGGGARSPPGDTPRSPEPTPSRPADGGRAEATPKPDDGVPAAPARKADPSETPAKTPEKTAEASPRDPDAPADSPPAREPSGNGSAPKTETPESGKTPEKTPSEPDTPKRSDVAEAPKAENQSPRAEPENPENGAGTPPRTAENEAPRSDAGPKAGDAPEAGERPPLSSNPRVAEGERVPLRDMNGRERGALTIGEELGAGSFHSVHRVDEYPDLVARVAKHRRLTKDKVFDEFGRNAMKDVDPDAVRVNARRGVFRISGGDNDGRIVELVDRVSTTAKDQLRANPGGTMTVGQAEAFDRATRAMNKKGLVWADNHRNNYFFEKVGDGPDDWRVVIIDPGGIFKMAGNAEEAAGNARAFQRALGQPRPDKRDFIHAMERRSGNVNHGARAGAAGDIRREIMPQFRDKFAYDEMNPRRVRDNDGNWDTLPFRADGTLMYPKAGELSQARSAAEAREMAQRMRSDPLARNDIPLERTDALKSDLRERGHQALDDLAPEDLASVRRAMEQVAEKAKKNGFDSLNDAEKDLQDIARRMAPDIQARLDAWRNAPQPDTLPPRAVFDSPNELERTMAASRAEILRRSDEASLNKALTRLAGEDDVSKATRFDVDDAASKLDFRRKVMDQLNDARLADDEATKKLRKLDSEIDALRARVDGKAQTDKGLTQDEKVAFAGLERKTARRDKIAADVQPQRDMLAKTTKADLEWLSGARANLSLAEMERAQDLLKANKSQWAKLLKDKSISPGQMHQITDWRKSVVDKMLADNIKKVQRPGQKIEPLAFGSNNLTSDYDLSIKIDSGEPGAADIIRGFNSDFRTRFGAEPGTVFDTNVYSEPAYTFFRAPDRSANTKGLTPKQLEEAPRRFDEALEARRSRSTKEWEAYKADALKNADEADVKALENAFEEVDTALNYATRSDALRQRLYSETAMRRYTTDKEWFDHKKGLLSVASPKEREALRYMFREVEQNYAAMSRADEARQAKLLGGQSELQRLKARQRSLEAEAKKGDGLSPAKKKELGEINDKLEKVALHASNETYADLLKSVERFSSEHNRISGLDLKKPDAVDALGENPPLAKVRGADNAYGEDLNALRNELRKAEEARAAGRSPEPHLAKAEEMRRALQNDLAEQIRNRQGQALFYASEAYQTNGAIAHVVGELQAGGRKITLESLSKPPVPSKLSADDYFNSFGENRANMLKEIRNQRVGNTTAFKDPAKAAAKASKYMIRQLDAGHQGGLDLSKLPDENAVKATLLVEANRGDLDAVNRALGDLGMTADEYVDMVVKASNHLSKEAFKAGAVARNAPEISDLARDSKKAMDAMLRGEGLAPPRIELRRSPEALQRNGRVARTLEGIEADGLAGLSKLSPEQAEDFGKAVEAARARAAREGVLNSVEERLIRTADSMATDARAANKKWRETGADAQVRDVEFNTGQGLRQADEAMASVSEKLTRTRAMQRMLGSGDETSRVIKNELAASVSDLEFRQSVLGDIRSQIAGERDASKAIKDAKAALKRAQQGTDSKAVAKARKSLDQANKTYREVLQNSRQVTSGDLDWLSGTRGALSKAEASAAQATLKRYKNRWQKMLKDPRLSASEIHRLTTWRKQEVDSMLDRIIGDVAKRTGVRPERLAFGSNNLTSDYDLSIKIAEGPGSAEVVRRFNAEFRDRFKAESGTVFDTNVYTEPAYTFIGASQTTRRGAVDVNPLDSDRLRQAIYRESKIHRFASAKDWAKHRAATLKGLPMAERKTFEYILDQAEQNVARAEEALDAGVAKAAAENKVDLARLKDELARAKDSGDTKAASEIEAELDNLRLQAANEKYADLLDEIDDAMTGFNRLQDGDLLFKPEDLGKLADDLDGMSLAAAPEAAANVRRAMGHLEEAENASTPAAKLIAEAQAEAELNEAAAKLAGHARQKQGEALYFASEAYFTQGAINHVVGELQAKGRKITFKSLTEPPTGELSKGEYLDSFYENVGDMMKELSHLRDSENKLLQPDKAAAKVSKYFVRLLDAAHQAGLDLAAALDDKAIRATVGANAVRGDYSKVVEELKKLKLTPDDFVELATQGANNLVGQAVRGSEVRQSAGAINREINAAEAARLAPSDQ